MAFLEQRSMGQGFQDQGLNYHGFNEFVEKIARGELKVQGPIKLPNMNHNTVHNVQFLDHCDHLCKKHGTNRLRLLSVIQQKLNADMILRLNQSPVFSDKMKNVVSEWGEEMDPMELFRCPNECYDSTNLGRMSELVKSNDDDYARLNGELTDNDSGLYEMMDRLKTNYHDCGEDINRNLSEIELRRDEYNPRHRDILCDLSTKQKSYYLDALLSDEKGQNTMNGVNMRINKGIPENIHVIFLNNLLIPNIMSKCMENHKCECMRMKQDLEEKQNKLNDVMVRIGPSEPLSDSILNLLSGFSNYFEVNEDDLPSDDEGIMAIDVSGQADEKIKTVLDNLVNRSIDDGSDDGSGSEGGEMYHLKITDQVDQVDKVDQVDQDVQKSGPMTFF